MLKKKKLPGGKQPEMGKAEVMYNSLVDNNSSGGL